MGISDAIFSVHDHALLRFNFTTVEEHQGSMEFF